MPVQNTDISNVTINIVIVAGVVVSLFGIIFRLILTRISTILDKLHESRKEIEKDMQHHHTAILDIYSIVNKMSPELARLEERITSIKENMDREKK